MKLWLPGIPGVHKPPEKIAAEARQVLGHVDGGFPLFSGSVAVRLRLVYPFPGYGEQPTAEQRETFNRARPTTLAWYYCAALEGVLWEGAEAITSVHASKEFGKAAGVEVIA